MAKQPQGICSSLFAKEEFPKVVIHLLAANGVVHSIYLTNTKTEAGQIHFVSSQNFFTIHTKLLHQGNTDGTLAMQEKGAKDEGEMKIINIYI